MKIKDIFDIKNIAAFVEGNAKYLYYEMINFPAHKKEQVLWRLEKCKDDCVPTGKCQYKNEKGETCGCPTRKKVLVNESCNKGERFPDLMGAEQWQDYKNKNGII